MKDRAIFLECTEKMEDDKKTTPEFDLLYRKAVLLSLRERNFLNDMQVQLCLEKLAHSIGSDENTLLLVGPEAEWQYVDSYVEEGRIGKGNQLSYVEHRTVAEKNAKKENQR